MQMSFMLLVPTEYSKNYYSIFDIIESKPTYVIIIDVSEIT